MAYITREHDDDDIIRRLLERRPDIKLGDGVRVDQIDYDPPARNEAPHLTIRLQIGLSSEDRDYILDNPRS